MIAFKRSDDANPAALVRIAPVLILMSAALIGCATVSQRVEKWACRNDVEVRCGPGRCNAESAGAFTPMSVGVDEFATISVCAYSGCWEGPGRVLGNDAFLVLSGRGLRFSTARASDAAAADVLIAIDRSDGVATLKVGEFAHPLLCTRGTSER